MPTYRQIEWNGYRIGVVPHDFPRDWAKFIPFFYGPIRFDLEIIPPRHRSVVNETFNYEWQLCIGKDDRLLRRDSGTVRFAPVRGYVRLRNRVGDMTRIDKGHFRKIGAVDLVHVSTVDRYKVLLRFSDPVVGTSEYEVTADFTVLDRDRFAQNIMSLVIGALFGAAFGAIASALVFVFTRGQ